tara:strand:- start:13546 stop:14127 length:582 start_codon:yes stop_codon:yes gene_type:complete
MKRIIIIIVSVLFAISSIEAQSYDYYFAKHTTCSKNLKFTIEGTDLSYTLNTGDELKISVPYEEIKIIFDNPCYDYKPKNFTFKPGGVVFGGKPKTRDDLFDSLYLTFYNINKLNKNKKDYKIEFKNATYDVKEINVSGIILKLKRGKVYYYRKSSYFPPKHYDINTLDTYNPKDGGYYIYKYTKNAREWTRN